MRLRGAYLLLATAASVGAMLVLAGPAAAANLHCGQVLDSSVTLIGNLDCSATSDAALYIGADDVTLNLNGFTVTGASGYDVIANYNPTGIVYSNGTLVKNGTLAVTGGGTGFDNWGDAHCVSGNGVTLDVVNIMGDSTSPTSYGIGSYCSTGLTMVDGSISGVYYGAFLYSETGDLIKNNTIETYDGGYGVYSDDYLTGVMIMGNAFTSDEAQTGTAYYAEYDAGTVFSGNTVTGLEWGVYTDAYNGGLMITGNVFGGADPADGLVSGIYLNGYDHGDVISGNFVRNSFGVGIGDYDSFNNTYVGNIATANGRSSDNATFDIEPFGYGPVTMVNNIARLGYSTGFYICGAYSDSVSGPPYSLFAGNSAIANGTDGNPGFWDTACEIEVGGQGVQQGAHFQPQQQGPVGSVGATWTGNVAKYNAADGFEFDSPWREIVTGNSASQNGDDGFLFLYVTENAQPLAVTNNSATYNGGYGFSGWDDEGQGSVAYPVAGSGNTGGGTNGYADCYLVAGCS